MIQIWSAAFSQAKTTSIQDFGKVSALAVLMFVCIAGVTAVALRFLRRREIQL